MKKRILSVLIVFVLLLNSMCVNASEAVELHTDADKLNSFSVEEEIAQDFSVQTYQINRSVAEGGRDVVLLLDISDSMAGEPLAVMKEAAVKFCTDIKVAKGNNRIGLVIYDANYRAYNLTSNIDYIISVIKDITLGGGTNIGAAFKQAEKMLINYSTENAEKNIVLMTDGVPLHGETSESGPYTADDHSRSYPYANATYNIAQNLMMDYNLYSLGFFHTMDNTTLEFARGFLKDVQNKGYYEVTEAENLEFVFGEVAEDIVKEDNKCPIIVVPGVMGSRLYSDEEATKQVWDPKKATVIGQALIPFWSMSDAMRYGSPLYVAGNGVNQVTAASREYGAQNTYEKLVNYLCDEFPDREIYVFSYDFRNSNEKSAQELNKYINSIVSDEHSKVDIVCHSMGGLVSSSYIEQYGSEKVRKIVTMGTPYEGAPKLLNSVLNWDVLSNRYESEGWDGFVATMSDNFLGLAGLQKEVKAGFPAIAELAPTEAYFENAYVFKQYKEQSSGFLGLSKEKWYEEIDYNTYSEICTAIFGNNYADAEDFHEALKTSNHMNVLASLDNSYFVVGINQYTIGAVCFNDETTLNKLECKDLYYEQEGDGTVPYYSATMLNKLKNIDNKSERYLEVTTDHTGVVKDSKALKWLYEVLNDDTPTVSSDNTEKKPYVVVRIACPVEVEIEKGGEMLSSSESKTSTSFGRLDFVGSDDEIKMVCMDADKDTSVMLAGTDSGEMSYSIRWFDGDGELEDERIFNNVPIDEDTIIHTNTNNDGATILNIDENGDGTVDSKWTASKDSYGKPEDKEDSQEKEKVPETGDTQAESIALYGMLCFVAVIMIYNVHRKRDM